jgi:hypothetical protein
MRLKVRRLERDLYAARSYTDRKLLKSAESGACLVVTRGRTETRVVPRANQLTIFKRSVLQRNTHVRTAILHRVEPSALTNDHQSLATNLDSLGVAIRQILVCQSGVEGVCLHQKDSNCPHLTDPNTLVQLSCITKT